MQEVIAHYDTFPFPRVDWLSEPDPSIDYVDVLNYDLGRCANSPLPREIRIWVPGCGTRHAVALALRYKGARILASDVSKRCLGISKDLAKGLKIKNIEYAWEDLAHSGHHNEFEFISCYGVLGYLDSPLEGLKRLRAALRRDGVLELMVNSRLRRYVPDLFHQVTKLFVSDPVNTPFKFNVVKRLIKAILRSTRCRPLNPYLKEDIDALGLLKRNLPQFSTALLNPPERNFDLIELFDLIHRGGFSFIRFCNQHLWEISNYIHDPELLRMVQRLPEQTQYQLIYLLGGYNSPLFELYLQRKELKVKRRRCDTQMDLLLEIVPSRIKPEYRYRVSHNKVISRKRAPLYRRVPKGLILDYGADERYHLPPITAKILKLSDGKNNVEQIIRKLCRSEGLSLKRYKAQLAGFIKGLFSPPTRLLFPQRCPSCKG